MSYHQQRTKGDIYGKSLAKEHNKEQKRQLEAYQQTLNTQLPITDKLAYDAQIFENQAAGNYQTGHASNAAANYEQSNDYYAAGPAAATINYEHKNSYYLENVDDQFTADRIHHTSFDFADDQYQSTVTSAAARTHHQDDVTDQLVNIAMGKNMKKEERRKKKKAAKHL